MSRLNSIDLIVSNNPAALTNDTLLLIRLGLHTLKENIERKVALSPVQKSFHSAMLSGD